MLKRELSNEFDLLSAETLVTANPLVLVFLKCASTAAQAIACTLRDSGAWFTCFFAAVQSVGK